MNWSAFSAVGVVVGAVALVLAVLHLAHQVRMSRLVHLIQAFQGIIGGFTAQGNTMFDESNAELVLRALAGDDELTEAEAARFDILLLGLLNQGELAFGAAQIGLLGQAEMENLDWWLHTRVFAYPGARTWLDRHQNAYHGDYSAWLHRISDECAKEG